MNDQPQPDKVQHARRFTAHHQGVAMHGVQFPSGRIIADHPYTGLNAYTSVEALIDGRDDVTVEWADDPEDASRYELVPGCPHCPDGHAPPDHGQPWNTYVHPDRDGDGQPTHIIVARSAGAHVAESDAKWIYGRLNGDAR